MVRLNIHFLDAESKAEMLAMVEVDGVLSYTLPGTLGLHEEYPLELYREILVFLETT